MRPGDRKYAVSVRIICTIPGLLIGRYVGASTISVLGPNRLVDLCSEYEAEHTVDFGLYRNPASDSRTDVMQAVKISDR